MGGTGAKLAWLTTGGARPLRSFGGSAASLDLTVGVQNDGEPHFNLVKRRPSETRVRELYLRFNFSRKRAAEETLVSVRAHTETGGSLRRGTRAQGLRSRRGAARTPVCGLGAGCCGSSVCASGSECEPARVVAGQVFSFLCCFLFLKLFCAVVLSPFGVIFNSETGLTAVAFLLHLFL